MIACLCLVSLVFEIHVSSQESGAVLLQKSLSFAEVGNFDMARKYIQKAEQIEPGNAYYWGLETKLLTNAQLRSSAEARRDSTAKVIIENLPGDPARQLKVARQALRLDRGNPWLHYSMAWILQREGNRAAAMSELEDAIKLDPTDPMMHVTKQVWLDIDDSPNCNAADEAVTATWLSPYLFQSEWFYNIKTSLPFRGFKDLGTSCRTSYKGSGDQCFSDSYLAKLGAMNLYKGDDASAMFFTQQALLKLPNLSEAWVTEGMTLLHQGGINAADQAFRKALFLNPDSIGAHIGLCAEDANIHDVSNACMTA